MVLSFECIHLIVPTHNAISIYPGNRKHSTAYGNLIGESHQPATYRKEDLHFYFANGKIGISLPVKELNKGLKELFHYLRHGEDPVLVKSCICHYAIQYYQPFMFENEKMSRLWQTLLLMKEHPSFEFLTWEKEVLDNKKAYYARLPGPVSKLTGPDSRIPESMQDSGASEFVVYMLGIIDKALTNLLESNRRLVTPIDRIRYFYTLQHTSFTRKDYMLVHKNISMTTASRDLDRGVESGFFEKHGSNNQTTYTCCPLFE